MINNIIRQEFISINVDKIWSSKFNVKANEFIFTPVGILTAIGIIYKLGVLEGIWSSFIGTIFIITFLILSLFII
jgi:hypothetical protein